MFYYKNHFIINIRYVLIHMIKFFYKNTIHIKCFKYYMLVGSINRQVSELISTINSINNINKFNSISNIRKLFCIYLT